MASTSTLTHPTRSEATEASPRVLRCSGTADFLAALPFLAGFSARNSLFIVLFVGNRAGNAMRLDLPPQSDHATLPRLIDAICELVSGTGLGPEGPAIVITSEQTFADAGGAPWGRFAKMLKRRFTREGWPLKDLAIVAPDGWAGLLDPGKKDRARPLSEIIASPVTELATRVVGDPPSLEELGQLPEPDAKRSAAICGRLAELDRRTTSRAPRRGNSDESPVRLHGVARVAGACFDEDRDPPDPRLCARLVQACESSDGWLVVLFSAVSPTETVLEIIETKPSGRMADSPAEALSELDLDTLLTALSMGPPDSRRLRRVASVLADVATHAPGPRRPGLLALLAWAWWMLGMQSVADRLIDTSLAINPDHERTRMVQRLAEAPPEWAGQGRLAEVTQTP